MSNPATETLLCKDILKKNSKSKVLPENTLRKFRELFELNPYKIFIRFLQVLFPITV